MYIYIYNMHIIIFENFNTAKYNPFNNFSMEVGGKENGKRSIGNEHFASRKRIMLGNVFVKNNLYSRT